MLFWFIYLALEYKDLFELFPITTSNNSEPQGKGLSLEKKYNNNNNKLVWSRIALQYLDYYHCSKKNIVTKIKK